MRPLVTISFLGALLCSTLFVRSIDRFEIIWGTVIERDAGFGYHNGAVIGVLGDKGLVTWMENFSEEAFTGRSTGCGIYSQTSSEGLIWLGGSQSIMANAGKVFAVALWVPFLLLLFIGASAILYRSCRRQ